MSDIFDINEMAEEDIKHRKGNCDAREKLATNLR